MAVKKKGSTPALWIVLFVIFLDWMGIALVYPMFSTMLFHPEASILDPEVSTAIRGLYLGLLLAGMSLAQFFSGPILGTLSDQKGRKPLLLWTILLAALGYSFSILGVGIKSIAVIILARILIGIAAGNGAVASACIADLSSKEEKAKNFGLYSMACGLGFSIGPYIGGKLASYGFSFPFYMAGLATLLNWVLVKLCFKETRSKSSRSQVSFSTSINNLKGAFKLPRTRAIYLTILIYAFGWSFFYEFIPVSWIYDYQLDAEKIGILFAYGACIYALSAGVLIRPFVKHLVHSRLIFYSLSLLTFVVALVLLRPAFIWVWVYLPIINFLMALIFPTTTTMVSNTVEEDAQGEALGILQSVQSAAFALSPLLAGSLLSLSPHAPILVSSLAMMVAATILGYCLRKEIFLKKRSN